MRALFGGSALFAALLSTSARGADVTQPRPGLTLARTGSDALVVADLCAAGVSVRATSYDERKATPSQWAQKASVQAEAAVNADFFDFPGWTLVNGRARGAGVDWPADKMLFEKRGYWEFGPSRAGWQPATLDPPAAPVVTEIVGAHNVIIKDGKSQAPDFDGDSVILTAHRRTGIGVSADHRYLYLFVSNASLGGAAMASAMLARAADAGFPQLDLATNEDGGGSSQMFVADVGPIFETGRPVNNHLGVLAKGTGAATQCPFPAPLGWLDSVSCESALGWAQSPGVPAKALRGVLAFDGAVFAPDAKYLDFKADEARDDLCKALGSCDHGFRAPTPWGAFDGQPHAVHAYAFNAVEGGPNAELSGSPKTLAPCALPVPIGRKRRIVSEAVLKSWNFSTYSDVLHVTDAVLKALPDDADVTEAPHLVRVADVAGELMLIDRASRRLVPSSVVARNWHFEATPATITSPAELEAWPVGPTLRARPMLVQGSGPERYLVDDANVPPDAGSGGAGQGGSGHAGGGAGAGASGVVGTNACSCTVLGFSTRPSGGAWLAILGASFLLGKRGRLRRLRRASTRCSLRKAQTRVSSAASTLVDRVERRAFGWKH